MKKKTRRGQPRKNALKKLKMMLNNVRGYKSKEAMIKRIIDEEEPVIMALTETKLNSGDVVEIEGYKVVRVDRDEEGGGVLIAYKETLNNIMVCTAKVKLNNAEMLWYKIDNGKVKLKLGVIYMPQESRTKLEKLKEIYRKIGEEVEEARASGCSLAIMGDLNCKIGTEITGNNEEITKGGRLLLKLVKKHRMKVLNAESCCNGTWTRIEGNKKSVIDYVIVFEEDLQYVKGMEIDEDKDITPYYVDYEGKGERKYTDHCMITTTWELSLQEDRRKTYAMVIDKDGWEKFRERIKAEHVSNIINDEDIQKTYSKWNRRVVEIKESCCKRVKIRKKWKVCRKLFTEKKKLKRLLKQTREKHLIKELKDRKENIQRMIDEQEQEKEYTRINKIVDEIKKSGGVNSNCFWETRRKLCGKGEELTHAMMNKEGEVCENPEEIKKIHEEWFKELLTTKKGDTEMEKQAEEIADLVWRSMKAIANNQQPQTTTYDEVEKIVQKLDPKKAQDECKWKNNMIKEGGEEMITSLVKISNLVDKQKKIPVEWQRMAIKTVHKKGDCQLMSNKRGLFLTNNVSKVYERVVKSRNQEKFNQGITEWQTGGITNRSGVDNVMTLSAVIEQNKYLNSNTYLVVTDAEKCFDKLWLKDGICELWRCGTDVRDCVMIKMLNEKAHIVVKTPVRWETPRLFSLKKLYDKEVYMAPKFALHRWTK